ncbi:MAG: adenylate/guanylate cyclase domain-containing protein [Hyphomicrobiaceae bacterium]
MRVRVMYWLAILAALGAAAVVRGIDPQPLARIRLVAFDTLQQLQPRKVDPAYPVRIISIDEHSLAAIGAWPWRRDVLAGLVERLLAMGAKVVALDFVLANVEADVLSAIPPALRSTPEAQALRRTLEALPSGDQRLAEVISGKPVVLGVIGRQGTSEHSIVSRAGFALLGSDPARYAPSLPAVTVNTPKLQTAAPGLGALNWFPEYDQVVRKVPMLMRVGSDLAPSLVTEAIRLADGARTISVRSSTASGETPFVGETGITSVRIGKYLVPTDQAGQMWLSFSKHDAGRFRSAVDLIEGRVPREDIAGRIVLIGATAPGLFDLRATPLDTVIAGVEIHAQAIEQILAGSSLHRPDLSAGMEVVFTTLAGLLLAILVRRAGPLSGAVMGAALMIAVMGSAWSARAYFGSLLDPSFPAVVLTALYIFCTGFFYFHTTRDRNRVRTAFSHYMAPSIVEELARRPDKLRLGGENRTVTLYRSDLAGFSKMSEELEPRELVELMAEYLTAMTDIVMDHEGFIDKYIGDAIDGVFGAPLDDPEHALHGAKAAMAARLRLEEMNVAGLAVLGGRTLRQRIGLHTGVGIVGNIGSRRRFNYTVTGDSANLASRLEGANKFYGTSILASEATVNLAGPSVAWRELDTVRVVGRTGHVRIYEPIALAAELTEDQRTVIASYADGLACWRSRDFPGAISHFERYAETDPPAQFFLQRCRKFIEQPPAADWQHIHTLESK